MATDTLRFTRSVIGYHGTTSELAEEIYEGKVFVAKSRSYHWLGDGVYFFENAPFRALAWARRAAQESSGIPGIVGAEIDLTANVVDLTDIHKWPDVFESYLKYRRSTADPAKQCALRLRTEPDIDILYDFVEETYEQKGIGNNRLDCAVLNYFSGLTEKKSPNSTISAFRASFLEGPPCFKSSFMFTRSHVQLCVIDQSIITDIFPVDVNDLSDRLVDRPAD